MKTFNLEQTVNLKNTIVKVMEDSKDRLSSKASFVLAKDLRLLQAECAEYEKVKQDLFQKYGEQIDDTHMKIKAENAEKYLYEIQKFESETVRVDLRLLTEEEAIESGLNAIEMYSLAEIIE